MTYTPDLLSGTEIFFQSIEEFASQNTSTLQQRKRLAEISLELFQNIKKHSEPVSASLKIEKLKYTYCITACNFIHKRAVKKLSKHITAINALARQDLKMLYLNTLNKTALSDKGGAGLGLYRIALRSACTLAHSFTQINNTTCTFTLQVHLNTHA